MGSKHRLLPWLEGVLGELEFDTRARRLLRLGLRRLPAEDDGQGGARERLPAVRVRPHPRDGRQLARHPRRGRPRGGAPAGAGRCALHRGDVPRHLLRRRGQPLPRPRRPPRRGARCRAPRARAGVAAPRLPQAPAARRVHRVRAGPLRRRAPRPAPLARGALPGVRRPLQRASSSTTADEHRVTCGDVFALDGPELDVDLVYLDPPYVPRADDNCYIKRYHFLEGLSDVLAGRRVPPHEPRAQARQAPHAVLLPARGGISVPPPLRALRGEHDRPLVLLERLPRPRRR